ncbi:hypothetical protein Pfo_019001, partial [Paulownia fortunei]
SPVSASLGLSLFSLNLSDDNIDGISSQRPIGVKKSKLKRKKDEQMSIVANVIEDETWQLVDILKHRSTDREQNYQIQIKKLALAEMREVNKILLKKLNSITHPKVREYFQNEQTRNVQKRAQQQHLGSHHTSDAFGQYFQDIGGFGAGLSDY